eukprot:c24277_g1_i1.p1 GENE.c24277_g1_i1~~c24277_g1_i1.p1  ORF type:complete len:159 (+),score=57.98 c24277_g1_i1:61-537(+)
MGIEFDRVGFITMFTVNAVLWMKLLFCLIKQGGAKVKAGARAPEDAKFFKNRKQGYINDEPIDDKQRHLLENVERWNNIVGNDLEQLPFGILIAWVSLPFTKSVPAYVACTIIFGLSRVLFSISYAYALQPWRSVFYSTALLAVLGLAINGFVGLADL